MVFWAGIEGSRVREPESGTLEASTRAYTTALNARIEAKRIPDVPVGLPKFSGCNGVLSIV